MGAAQLIRDWAVRMLTMVLRWCTWRIWSSVRLGENDAALALEWLRRRPDVRSAPQLTLYARVPGSQGALAGGALVPRQYDYEPELQTSTWLIYVSPKTGRRRFLHFMRNRRRADSGGEDD